MILKFENASGSKLAEGIRNIKPKEIDEMNRIENVTLSGMLHVQIIGKPTYTISFEVLCNGEQQNLINTAYATGEKINFHLQGIMYSGLIKSSVTYKRFGKLQDKENATRYTAKITLSIVEESIV